MTKYSNLVVLSPPNDIDNTEHNVIIIISVVLPTFAIIMMGVIVPLVLICKWKIRRSSEVYHCSGK